MKTLILILTLFGLLAAAVGVAIYVWVGMSDVELSTHGVIALILGVLVSLALGVGLMALVFYSHRKGHDDIDRPEADPGRDGRHG